MKRSRESTDLTNVRTAYGEMMADINLDGKDPEAAKKTVQLKQKIDDWQSAKTITIAGISHTVGEPDTDNWVGIPGANGTCEISLNDDNSVRFTWSGGKESDGKKYPFKCIFAFNRIILFNLNTSRCSPDLQRIHIRRIP